MRATEGGQRLHWRAVATLDVSAEEEAALREADGVDGRGNRQDGIGGDEITDGGNMFCEVAQEGGGAVRAGVFVYADIVGVGGADARVEEGTD